MEKQLRFMERYVSVLTTILLSLLPGMLLSQSISEWTNSYIPISEIRNVHTDPLGNVFMFAEYNDYDGPLTLNSTTVFNSSGFNDGVLAKFRPDGSLIWAIDFKNPKNFFASEWAFDPDGNIYLSIEFFDVVTFSGRTLTGQSGLNHAIVKLTPDGQFVWSEMTGLSEYTVFTGDRFGNFYIIKAVKPNVPLKFGQHNYTTSVYEYAMIKFNIDKIASPPVKIANFTGNTYLKQAKADNSGYIYVNGTLFSNGSVTLNGTRYNATTVENDWLTKVDPNGNILWHKRLGDAGSNVNVKDLAIDKQNNLYVAGGFTNSFTYSGTSKLTSTGYLDNFIVKYNSAGTVLKAKAFGVADGKGATTNNFFHSLHYASYNDQLYYLTDFSPKMSGETIVLDNFRITAQTNYGQPIFGRIDRELNVLSATLTGRIIGDESGITSNEKGDVYYSTRNYFEKLGTRVITRKAGINFDFPIDVGNALIGFNFSDIKYNTPDQGFLNDVGFQSEDIFHKVNMLEKGKLTVSHCGSGIYDSYLYIYNSARQKIFEIDDYGTECGGLLASCSPELTPGVYYIVSEGYANNVGELKINIRVDPIPVTPAGATASNPVILGTIPVCFNYTDTKNNAPASGFGNEIGYNSDDIFYKFTLTQAKTINVSTCSSTHKDTYLYILAQNGTTVLHTNDDNGPSCTGLLSSISVNLQAGTYYIVTEGYGMLTGDITVRITSGTGCKESDPEPLSEPVAMQNMTFYPNPASDFASVKIPQLELLEKIQLVDLLGNIVMTDLPQTEVTELNISAFPTGMYILNAVYPDKTLTEKIQIVR